MNILAEYRKNARLARALAREAGSDATRQEWLNIASHWAALAKARADVETMIDGARLLVGGADNDDTPRKH